MSGMKKWSNLWDRIKCSRKLRCGGFSMALTAGMVVLVVLVAALCDGLENHFALEADFSFNGATSQGEITKNAIAQLEKITGVPVPQNLRGLDQRPVLHRDVIDQAEMLKYVLKKAEEKQWNK